MLPALFNLMGMMFLLMASGCLLKKKNIITAEGKAVLTNLILYVILPCNIIKAFCVELKTDSLSTFLQALAVAAGVQLLSLLIAEFAYSKSDSRKKPVYQYGTVCSNAGFMGNPLAQEVFGDTGLLYAAVFLIPLRIVMWTAGVSYFSDKTDKKAALKKVLVHPCMIAVYIGMVIMIEGLTLPAVLMDSLTAYSSCTTGMTMMYLGTILADVDFKTLCDKEQVYFSLIRLVIIPLVVMGVCMFFHVDSLVMGVSVLLSATPAGSTTSILAGKYGADELAAARSVVFTTALSIITIPVWSGILLIMI
ncbi:MAG: AEC family transporter [Lachnospiraceae bacterium]